MACPSSGIITMKGIHQELNVNDYANAVFDNNTSVYLELSLKL